MTASTSSLPTNQCDASWHQMSDTSRNRGNFLPTEGTSEREILSATAEAVATLSSDSEKLQNIRENQADFRSLSVDSMQITDLNLSPNVLSWYASNIAKYVSFV